MNLIGQLVVTLELFAIIIVLIGIYMHLEVVMQSCIHRDKK